LQQAAQGNAAAGLQLSQIVDLENVDGQTSPEMLWAACVVKCLSNENGGFLPWIRDCLFQKVEYAVRDIALAEQDKFNSEAH
jgi:hypothetical protein